MIINGGDHIRMASDDICVAAAKSLTVNADVRLVGDIKEQILYQVLE